MARHVLDKIAAVTPGYTQVFSGDGWSVLLAATENEVRAIRNICPHAGSPLNDARIAGSKLRCPRHGYLFSMDSGICRRGEREGFGPLSFVHLYENDGHYEIEI